MSAGALVWIVAAALAVCCLFTHRRAIQAMLARQPRPGAPEWHFRVDPGNRRG